jgi:carboxyl-terminal processing protease
VALAKLPKKLTTKNLTAKFKALPKGFKTTLNVVILLAIFGVGVGVGQGKIVFGPDAVYHKSVQKGSLPDKLDYNGVNELYADLQQSYDGQLDVTKLEDGLKQGLVKAAGDPYTEFLNQADSKDFSNQLSGTFEGIGAELGKQGQTIVVISPIAGFPAEKAGLKAGDKIVQINGETAYDLSISDAVDKIRGPKGTTVKLQVLRGDQPVNLDITRDQITLPSVKSELKDGTGVITVSRFGEDTVDLATKAATDLKAQGAKSIVLDLRGNPGGLVDAAVGLSSLWLDKSQVVLQEKRDGKVVKTYHATSDNPPLRGMKTVVMVDSGSASASEITAGTLHDNKVATIIGTKSYGKGSVQEVRGLNDGGTLKVTIARWYTPAGRNIDKEGIEPDKKVDISAEDVAAKRDPQLNAALEFLR